MIDSWALWMLLVGLGLGAGFVAVLLVRLPRQRDDLGEAERRTEAAWISGTIEHNGGVAPTSLVEEVLELDGAYRAIPRPPAPQGASAPPMPPGPRTPPMVPPPPPGYAPPSGPPPSGPPPSGPPPSGPPPAIR